MFARSILLAGLLLALCPSPTATAAQVCLPAWRAMTTGEGPLDEVFSLARGPDGFVYFGNAEGLHRATGVGVQSWFPDPADPAALPDGRVRALAAVDGGLYVGTTRGLSWFDVRTERFSPRGFGLPDGQTSAVFALEVVDDRLYVGHARGGAVLDLKSGAVVGAFETGGRGSFGTVYAWTRFRDGMVATSRHRHLFVGRDAEARPLCDEAGAPLEVGGFTAARAPDGAIWLGTLRGVLRVPADPAQPVTAYPEVAAETFERGVLKSLAFDDGGRLWMATDYGYAQWNLPDAAPTPVPCRRAALEDPDRPLPTRLFTWALDGAIVAGSSGRSPVVARPTPWAHRLSTEARYVPGMAGSTVWSGAEDGRGRLVLATMDGVFREAAAGTRRFVHLSAPPMDRVQAMSARVGPRGRLWVATFGGLYVVDDEGARALPLVREASGKLSSGAVISLQPHGDTMLAATDNGLVVIDAERLEVRHFFSNDPGATAVNGAPVTRLADSRALHVETAGPLAFVVGREALHRVHLETGRVEATARAESDFAAGRIYASAFAPNGKLYVGTANGMVVTDPDLKHFEYLTELEGTRLGKVSALDIAADGSLWHTSNTGLWRHHLNAGTRRRFSKDDGLHTLEVNQGGLTLLADGRVIAASPAGATVFDPAAVPVAPLPAPRLLRYTLGDRAQVYAEGPVRVPAEVRALTLGFGAPVVRLPTGTRLEYRLGLDGEAGTLRRKALARELDFTALAPGDYRLQARFVQAGRPSSAWTRLTIVVEPPWWRTGWALAGFGVLLVGAGAGALRWRARRIAHDERLVRDERVRIAQDFHDNSLQELIGAMMVGRAVAETLDGHASKASADKMVTLLEGATKSARLTVNDLSETHAEAATLAQAVREHRAADLYGAAPPVDVSVQGRAWGLGPQRTYFLSRLAKEAINNAAKHASASRIDVSLRWTWATLTMELVDDGRGFDVAAAGGRGFGLAAMHRLADAGRARLTITSSPGAGTRVRMQARRFVLGRLPKG